MSPWDVIGWLLAVILTLFTVLLVSAFLVATVKRIVAPRKTTVSKPSNVTPLKRG